MKRAMVFRRAFFCGKSPGEGAGKAGVSDTACRREHVRPCPEAAHGNDAACRRGAPVFFGGMLFLRASPTDRGSRAGWGRVLARGRIFFEGSRDRRGESYWTGEREACRGGGCAGRTGIPGRGGRSLRGGPLSSGGAAQKRVTPDGHFLMWGRALRGRSIGRKSESEAADAPGDSPEETARKKRRTREERRERRGEKFPAGAASGTEPCGDEKARSLFSPAGRHGIGRGGVPPWGGRKKGVCAARRGWPRRPSAAGDREGRRGP